jgi:hypothetical protein
VSAQPFGLRRLSRSVGTGVHEKQQAGVNQHPRASTQVCPIEVFTGRACRCTKKKSNMKIIGMIRSTGTQEVEAEGEDYVAAREQLLASIPEGFELLHVRRDS